MSQPTTLRQRLPGILWSAFLGALLAVGGLSVLLRIWGTLSPGILGPAAAALVGGLQQLFWQDDPAADDGIYSAITRVREVLRQTATYTVSPQPAAEDVDPIRDFLTGSRQGNSMLYASAAVQALRSCGIPARYVEGYYLSAAALENSGGKAAALTGQDAHAWAEVYFDGIGWLPVDVTPGYYFDAVTLQQMVALPDTVQKTAALVENGDNSGAPAEGGAASGGAQSTPLVVFKNTLWVLLGLLVLAVFVLTVLFALAELLRLGAERRAAQAYHRANADQKVRLQYRQLFRLLRLWGVDAALDGMPPRRMPP